MYMYYLESGNAHASLFPDELIVTLVHGLIHHSESMT